MVLISSVAVKICQFEKFAKRFRRLKKAKTVVNKSCGSTYLTLRNSFNVLFIYLRIVAFVLINLLMIKDINLLMIKDINLNKSRQVNALTFIT